MLSSCICSTLVSVCAMKGIPIGPLAQWGKDLTYYLTPFFCLVNWDMYCPGKQSDEWCVLCRATLGTPASVIFNFFNFQNHYEHVPNNFWKYFLISKTTASMFPTTCESFIAIRRTVCALVGKVQHGVLQLIQFSIFFNFQKHPGNVYNNLWKFHRNRMNGVCSCTGHTHTHSQTLTFIYKISNFLQLRVVLGFFTFERH